MSWQRLRRRDFDELDKKLPRKAGGFREAVKFELSSIFEALNYEYDDKWDRIYFQFSAAIGDATSEDERSRFRKTKQHTDSANKHYFDLLYWMYLSYEEINALNNSYDSLTIFKRDEKEFRQECNEAANRIFEGQGWPLPIEKFFDEEIRQTGLVDLIPRKASLEISDSLETESATIPLRPIPPTHTPVEDVGLRPPIIPLPTFDDDTQASWLNPFRQDAIPFVPRVEERRKLDDFISSKKPFQICALTGPSGAGKTRFAAELMRYLNATNDWITGFVDKDDPDPAKSWGQWIPYQQNTLVVVDYTYATGELVKKIIKKCDPQSRNVGKTSGTCVRILLLNHLFDKSNFLDGALTQHRIDYFHSHTPIELKGGDPLLRQIVKQTSRVNDESEQIIDQALAHLKTMGAAAQHPLFAALLGQTVKDGIDFENWNRRGLIDNYLSSTTRLPWLRDQAPDQTGRWIGILVSVATLLRGCDRRVLSRAVPDGVSGMLPIDVVAQSMSVVSSQDANTLTQLEPDILGEAFFLKFLIFALDHKNAMPNLIETLHAGADEKGEELACRSFLEVTDRLVRNLINDDQKFVDPSWYVLIEFLRPKKFRGKTLLRQAVTVALGNIIVHCSKANNTDLVSRAVNSFDLEEIPSSCPDIFRDRAIVSAVYYFDWIMYHELCDKRARNVVSKFFEMHVEKVATSQNLLVLAVQEGCLHSAIFLKEHLHLEIDSTDTNGNTALMISIQRGDEVLIKWLITQSPNVNAMNRDGVPIIYEALETCGLEIIKLLVDAGANLEDNDGEGSFPLQKAVRICTIDIIQYLIDENIDVDKTNFADYSDSLHAAVHVNRIDVAEILLNKVKYKDGLDDMGMTPLDYAISLENTEMENLLRAHGCKTSAEVWQEWKANRS